MNGPRQQRTRLRDVAERAFVSVTTASNALHGKAGVAEETRRRVQQVAADLGYRPSHRALTLQGSAPGPVGLLVGEALLQDFEDMPRLFGHRLLRQLSTRLAAENIAIQLIPQQQQPATEELSALVVVGDQPINDDWFTPGLPVIVLGQTNDHDSVVMSLTHDHEQYALEVVAHLREQGATQLAIIRPDIVANYSEIATSSVEAAAQGQGLSVNTYVGSFSSEQVHDLAQLSVAEGADAIFLLIPFPRAALAGIRAAGARVPDDVLLVGRTEGAVEAETDPPVSVVSMQAVACADLLAQALIAVVRGADLPTTDHLPYRFLVRESSLRTRPSRSDG